MIARLLRKAGVMHTPSGEWLFHRDALITRALTTFGRRMINVRVGTDTANWVQVWSLTRHQRYLAHLDKLRRKP